MYGQQLENKMEFIGYINQMFLGGLSIELLNV